MHACVADGRGRCAGWRQRCAVSLEVLQFPWKVCLLVSHAAAHLLRRCAVELERACAEGVEGVVEAAAVACPAPGGGPDQLHLFLVLRPGSSAAALPTMELQQLCQAAISSRLNPLFRVGGRL